MNNPPAGSETSAPPTLFHRAGSYAIGAIVASFILQLVCAQARLHLPPTAARWLGLIPALVMVTAVPAGLIALCGIPSYGVRKLLWKGLVGLFVPVLLLVLAMYVAARFTPILKAGPGQVQTSQ